MTNSRDIGLDHGAGKGDKDRSNRAVFRIRFPVTMSGNVSGFERRGRRLVKVYGRQLGKTSTRRVSQNSISLADYVRADPDFAVAQRIADDTNAGFRARGIDTLGH